MSTTPPHIKRLRTELSKLASERPPPYITELGPVADNDLSHWTTILKGTPGTAYEHGSWLLDIRIPEAYPMRAPEIKFLTKICHANVHWKTGEICLDLLKDQWNPTYTVLSTLEAVHHLLDYPEPDSPLNVDVAVLMRNRDLIGAESVIRWACGEWRWEGSQRKPVRDV